MQPKRLQTISLVLRACLAPLVARAARPLSPDDWYRFQDVSDVHVAPDGAAVAYLVTSYEKESDQSRSSLWIVDWSGKEPVQLTRGESVSQPRFSPDGRYLSFLSARPAGSTTQLWVLDRRGGEARAVTHVSSEIVSYEWSPDGRRTVLVMHATEPGPRPLVIDAYHFKQDRRGYLTAAARSHLYLLDLESDSCEALTADPAREDSLPAFSPDGRTIAYVSNEMVSPKGAGIDEIELIAPAAGSAARRLLTTWSPNHQRLEWSPDGRLIAFLQGDELKYNAYILDSLAVAEVSSGRVRPLTASLDRAVLSPHFTADGAAIELAVEDDGAQYPAKVRLPDGAIERLAGRIVVSELATAAGHTAVLASDDHSPFEVSALEAGKLRPLTAHNRGLFAELALGSVEDIAFASRDGTQIHGQLVKPPDYVRGRRYPLIVWIHGGPNGQDQHELILEGRGPSLVRQLFATHGYVALAINYRGSTGRGAKFARSIVADWGHLEVEDLRAGADYAIAQGIADPQRLGIGGWSYGGYMAAWAVTQTTRFKAAVSGAPVIDMASEFGTEDSSAYDEWFYGTPYERLDGFIKSSPMTHVKRAKTPTLILQGEDDETDPIGQSQQFYRGLKRYGVETELVLFPREPHGLREEQHLLDRLNRMLAWYDRYLKPSGALTSQPQ